MSKKELPLPPYFNPDKVSQLWRVSYEERFRDALQWSKLQSIPPAHEDSLGVCLILVDVQNTFCLPDFELYVRGRSGTGAIDDNRRLCKFIYKNLHRITQISPTMDTHQILQIFHSIFLIDEVGEHPSSYTLISEEEIRAGRWKINPAILPTLQLESSYTQAYLQHYVHELRKTGKYDLTIWPYHAMLGGIGHALVPAIEEAIFFHSVARCCQPDFQIKGDHPLTEHYSVIGPEVMEDAEGKSIATRNDAFLQKLTNFEMIVIAGQAKSHCVAWTIDDLLKEMHSKDEEWVRKVYLLEDCTSPVVIEGIIDYTEDADRTFQRFADAGMNIVRSTTPIEKWPKIKE
ncbi:MAG: isochorismatase [Chloroflexi bacterium RBG_16_48_8]|nr:MAG: isochorismatase [Chloroflexi bacterium RBG_16_48_8]